MTRDSSPPPFHKILTIIVIPATWLILASPLHAQEYRRAQTDGDEGPFLYWRERAITFSIDAAGCPDTDLGQTRAAVIRAFNTWESQPCTDIFFVFDGMVDGAEPNHFTREADGHNLITWIMDWPEEWGARKLALTNFVWNERTGEILDVDIAFNGRDYYWTAGDRTVTDIENVLVHEIGHLLGFAHTTDTEASLYDGYVEGEIEKRDLSATDIHGLCEVYPSGRPTPDVPELGIDDAELSSGACHCRSANRSDGHGVLWLLVLSTMAIFSTKK
jgi:hypothetical protein